MKRLKFLETKRTPRYSLRKFSVGVASVLLGVTIFGINFTNHSVKAATGATGEVQRSSGSNTAAGTTGTDGNAAGTPGTTRTTGTDGNAAGTPGTTRTTGTDGNAAGTPGTPGTGTSGTDKSGADVDPNNINKQPAKENQKLANEHNLSSSDNHSSNIYKGKDGKYYKIVTIYGNDYVYQDRKSTRLNSSHTSKSRMPSSA